MCTSSRSGAGSEGERAAVPIKDDAVPRSTGTRNCRECHQTGSLRASNSLVLDVVSLFDPCSSSSHRHAVSMAGQATTAEMESTHANFGPLLNLAIWTLAGSATVFLGLRLFAKHRGQRLLWFDDYLLIAAWVWLLKP